jgi:4-amino-4-deoxy-L-arabinose transferase-like glycosyltransferase
MEGHRAGRFTAVNAQIVGKQREAARHPVGGRGIDLLAVGVFALALCARLIHIWAISKSPFFDQLLVDSVDFDARAMAFMQGRWLEAGAFFQAPLYPLFLALIYKVFGHSLLAVRLVQAVLGSGTALLVYLVGRRCCGRSVGLVAGLIASLYSMAIHFDAEILRPPLVLFLAVLGLYLLLSAAAKDGLRGWAAAGFILGLASIARPTLLVFLPLAGLWVYFGHGQKGTPGVRNSVPRAAATALFLCCSLVPVGTVTSINYARSGQFVLISYNGGINFYIGNNPDYEATVAIRPGIRWDLLTSEPAADRRTDPSGWSRYYYDKAFHYIESDPEGYAGLVLKKLVLFWNGHEIERNVDFSHVAEYSPFMAHRLVSFVWVAPLALVGMVMAWRKKAPMGLLALYFLSQMAATVAFFVCARYRMIAMPALWVFAAYAGVVLTTTLKRGPITALPYLALVAAAAVGVNYNAYNISDRHYTRPDYELGLIMRREGRTDECLALLRRSEAERPDDPDPPFQRGTTLAGSTDARWISSPATGRRGWASVARLRTKGGGIRRRMPSSKPRRSPLTARERRSQRQTWRGLRWLPESMRFRLNTWMRR